MEWSNTRLCIFPACWEIPALLGLQRALSCGLEQPGWAKSPETPELLPGHEICRSKGDTALHKP